MMCRWENAEQPDAAGNRRVRCIRCGYVTRTATAWPFEKIIAPGCRGWPLFSEWREWQAMVVEWFTSRPAPQVPPPPPPLNAGPGTELHKLLAELGIKPDASCGCAAMQAKMDAWGPNGCREHEAEILEHLTAAYKSTDWPTVLTAGTRALRLGYPLTLRGLLALAIERSELATTAPASPG